MNLAADYVEKWSVILQQSELIDRDLATNSINQIYCFLELSQPTIQFSSQPGRTIDTFLKHKLVESDKYNCGIRVEPQLSRKAETRLKHQLGLQLAETLTEKLLLQLNCSIRAQIGSDLESQLWISVENSIRKQIDSIYPHRLRNFINCREWICYVCKFDLCINELNVSYNPQLWEIIQSLVTSCNWFLPFSKVCLIGDCSVTKFF
jgi:hypothetical protein